MKRLLVGAICAVVGASAMADEWRLALVDDDSAYLYNATSVQTYAYNTVGAWVLVAYRPEYFNHNLYWIEFNCDKKSFRPLESYTMKNNGKQAERESFVDASWHFPLPGDRFESVLKHVCKKTGDRSFRADSVTEAITTTRTLLNWKNRPDPKF